MPKFNVMFKMPSAGDDAIKDAVEDRILANAADIAKARALTKKFFRWDEYAYIEIDTDKGTAKVLPATKD